MWKIIPKLEIIRYDNKVNFWTRKVTYSVQIYDHPGMDHPNLPQQVPDPNSVAKEYDYIYTGNNKDVIRADLDFKIAFFEAKNAAISSYTGDDPDKTITDNQNDGRLLTPGYAPNNGSVNTLNSSGARDALEPMVIADLMNKILDNNVDLLRLELELVGDPDWIQQDNILYSDTAPLGQKILPNGTINHQGSATLIKFTFKTPVSDYDNTGMLNVKDLETVVFSGLYQVHKITSTFRKGRFNQKLDCTRLRIQTEKDLRVKSPAAAPTTANTSNQTSTIDSGQQVISSAFGISA